MKNYPTVLRTQYILALRREANAAKADTLQQAFDKMARTYPYPTELAADRMLMSAARKRLHWLTILVWKLSSAIRVQLQKNI